ncbi:MAG: TIM barrel protein, partial [Micrococcales bacterium]|nr:TIM barrel protein [Micrococcales bacterium]
MSKYTVNCSILLTDLPVNERPAAAAKAGFEAVEFWWPFAVAVPSADDVDAFVNAVQEAGVQLSGLNFFAGDMPAGERGLVSSPSRSAEFNDNIAVVVEIGRRLNCTAFNALYGLAEDGVDAAEQAETAIKNLNAAGRAVAEIGGTVLLEPVSGAEAYPVKTAQDALDIIAKLDVDNVKLLA